MVLESTVSWKMAGGAWVSMVLTSTPHWHRMPGRNRSIPTIFARRVDVGLVDVSAVDTGSAGGIDSAGPWRPCGVLSTRGRPHHPLSCPFRLLPRGPVAPTRHRLRPAPARVGLLHEDGDLLVEGCAYCTKAPPTRSAPALLRWIPTLVQYRPGAIPATAGSRTAPAAGRVKSRGPGPPASVP